MSKVFINEAKEKIQNEKNLCTKMLQVTEMVEEVKTEVKERITYAKWMDNNTKEYLITKINTMKSQIGYPKWYNNQSEFIERHEGVGHSMHVEVI